LSVKFTIFLVTWNTYISA